MSNKGKAHMARVAQLPCVACLMLLGVYNNPVQVHHVEGSKDDLCDFLTVPLCVEHHIGKDGVHGLSRRGFEARYKLSQLDLLAKTIELLESNHD